MTSSSRSGRGVRVNDDVITGVADTGGTSWQCDGRDLCIGRAARLAITYGCEDDKSAYRLSFAYGYQV